MSWFKDNDGTWALYIDPDSTITTEFKFILGKDASCTAITISSVTFETNSKISVVSDSLSGNKVIVQTTGNGELLIILTLSNGDVRRVIRRYTETSKSRIF